MILPTYFMREAFKLTIVIVGGLFVVYLSMRFATHLGEAAEGKVAPQHISRIVLLKMFVSLKDLLPMALLLGVFGAAVRIQQNFEWTAMRAGGLAHQQLLKPTLVLAGGAAIIVAAITLVAGPRVELSLRELREKTENEATIAGVKAGRFREFSGGKRVFYAEAPSADESYLERVFVRTGERERREVMRSARAVIEIDARSRDRFAVFENGSSWAGEPGARDYVVTDFTRYGVRIENREPTLFGGHVGFLFSSELLRHSEPAYRTELQWRMALPICTLLGPLLALLVATAGHRTNWYLGLITLVATYFAYTNLLGVGRSLMRKEAWPAWLGLWPIHLLFAALVLSLFLAQRRLLRLRRRPTQQLLRATRETDYGA